MLTVEEVRLFHLVGSERRVQDRPDLPELTEIEPLAPLIMGSELGRAVDVTVVKDLPLPSESGAIYARCAVEENVE